MISINKKEIVAVIADGGSDVNREYRKKKGDYTENSRMMIITAKSGKSTHYETDLTARTLERRLQTDYYLNI